MRGEDAQLQPAMFSYVSLERRVPSDHPLLRAVRALAGTVLKEMSRSFGRLYADNGSPLIPPERLPRALLLQSFYSVRSERLDHDLLFRWFVGLEVDDPVWNHAVFSKNRERLLNDTVAGEFFVRVKAQAAGLMSDEHFTVDGTLIAAWAGQKSFRPKDGAGGDGPDGKDFRGQRRRNHTHASKTDLEARLYRKTAGQEAKLACLGHTVVENRNGLIVAAMATQADGRAERDAGLLLAQDLRRGRRRMTLGADKAYDSRDFVGTLRDLHFTPHVHQRAVGSAVDQRTTRQPGYRVSLQKRWLVEKPFGWLKSIAGLRQVKLRALDKMGWLFVFGGAAYNLLRIPKLRARYA